MRTLLFSLALAAAGILAPLEAQTPWFGGRDDGWDSRDPRYSGARLWVEGERDYFRRGDRMDVRFSASDDAYVALIHVDTDGDLQFLFPVSPWDEGYVRGGRVYSLPRGAGAGRVVRDRPGMGYIYMIASPVPLDYRSFSRNRGGPWDWSYAGRAVRGDPFWAMEQITRLLLPDPYAPYATDYFSYHVDGRYRYPSYACADRYGAQNRGWGWSSAYGGCDRLDFFLREHPNYYDARLYRGDRRSYFRERYDYRDPRHDYKEPLDRRPVSGWDRSSQPTPAPRAVTPQRREAQPRAAEPERRAAPQGERAPERRPALERRPAPRANDAPRDRPSPAARAVPRSRRPAPSDTLQVNR